MLEERILKTLRFFNIQKYAVTLLELHRFLIALSGPETAVRPSVSPAEVLQGLESLRQAGKVAQQNGYYTLAGQEALFDLRWRGYRYGVWREKIIRRTMKGLACVPFVRGVALAGSQALGLQKAESDIDLLVITEPKWLWLPRTLVTAYFQILGIRRHGTNIANRVCLNHYLSGPKAMIVGHNWYTALEYSKLRPLVGAAFVAQFQERNRKWVCSLFPHAVPVRTSAVARPIAQGLAERVLTNAFGRYIERVLGNWQGKRIHKDEPHIIVEADELSFHPKSKQDALLEEFKV
ncbi:MAG: nucleotidyltransferase domain-containing protein [Candidatus Doudnabacteria bacterium]|nr:nucleotidyltransferase domain-containing protein [Candidatus Doudnabacteria bacterium]